MFAMRIVLSRSHSSSRRCTYEHTHSTFSLVVTTVMNELVSSEDIQARCHDLVYQVAYAFYDTPYIILLKLLVLHRVYVQDFRIWHLTRY